jgi:hypothetical protein
MRTTGILVIVITGSVWFSPVGQAATELADACKDTKARAAGQKAADLLSAFGKNFKRSDPTRLAFSISQAQSMPSTTGLGLVH